MQRGGGMSGRIAREAASSTGSAGASSAPGSAMDSARSGVEEVGPMAAQFGEKMSCERCGMSICTHGQVQYSPRLGELFKARLIQLDRPSLQRTRVAPLRDVETHPHWPTTTAVALPLQVGCVSLGMATEFILVSYDFKDENQIQNRF